VSMPQRISSPAVLTRTLPAAIKADKRTWSLLLTFLHAIAASVLCCVQRLGIDKENLIVCRPDYG
jgi:hypothetical protein